MWGQAASAKTITAIAPAISPDTEFWELMDQVLGEAYSRTAKDVASTSTLTRVPAGVC